MSQAEIIDATDEEYFAMDALDQSQLKAFLKNPTVGRPYADGRDEVRHRIPRLPVEHERGRMP